MARGGPRFSILVAAFNVAATIDRCIESVAAARKHHDVELIVVDDGSTDRTGEICAGYARNVPWIRVLSQPNAGEAEVRNRLLREAAGEYVAFVDGDDSIEPRYFDLIDEKLRETGADLLVFGHYRVELDGTVLPRQNMQADLGREDAARLQLRVADNAPIYMLCCTRVFRKELCAGYAFDPRIKLGPDTAFNIHVMNQASRTLVVPDCLYNYFESPGSISSGAFKPALLESFEAHFQARCSVHMWPEVGTADFAVLKGSIALSYVEHVLQYLLNNVRHMPLKDQLGELKRIRQSVIYQQCIPDYDGRSRYRGVRFLVHNFVRERYWAVLLGCWLTGGLTRFREFVRPSRRSRQGGKEKEAASA